MCGPTGSLFGVAISAAGVLFLSFLAILIQHDYPYVGEWFDPKGEPGTGPVPLDQQREQAVHGLWVAVVIYAILFGVSAVFACIHKLRGSL